MDVDQFRARIAQIHRDLDAYTYYDLLKVGAQATPDEIRAAFHRMALSMHPDRYQTHPDPSLKKELYVIYKRVAEAYRVLMDDEARRNYNAGLAEGKRRLVQKERKRSGPKRKEQSIDNPQARKFFMMGQDAERRGDKKNARMNYKFALDLAEDHPLIREKFDALAEEK